MAGAAAQNTGYGEWAEYESLPSTPRKPILWIQKSMTYGQVLVTGGMGFWRFDCHLHCDILFKKPSPPQPAPRQQEKPPYLILLYLIFAQLNIVISSNITCVSLIFALATLFLIYLISHYLMRDMRADQ